MADDFDEDFGTKYLSVYSERLIFDTFFLQWLHDVSLLIKRKTPTFTTMLFYQVQRSIYQRGSVKFSR